MQTSDGMSVDQNESLSDSAVIDINGSRYKIYLPNSQTDYIQKKIATELKPYELPMLEDMRARLSSDDLVLDIGANIGNHTLYLGNIVGCKVVAFEPNSSLVEALKLSVLENGIEEKVHVLNLGVGEVLSTGHFEKYIPNNLGGQSITLGEGDINIVPLDSQNFNQKVSMIKVDVEGMEISVLKGAKNLLMKDRPLLYVECIEEKDFREVSEWLTDIEYFYWDTFNASPTHLFMPSENLSIDQKISRIQFKNVLDSYRGTSQLKLVRSQLDQANLKYRAATESINQLKVRVADEQNARLSREASLAELQKRYSELEHNRDQLVIEIDILKKNIENLESQKILSLAEMASAKNELINLERTNSEIIEKVAELKGSLANERYLKEKALERLDEATSRLEDEEARVLIAENECEKLRSSINKFKDDLSLANFRYRSVTQQFSEIKQSTSQEISELKKQLRETEKSKRDAEQRLIKTRASLTYQLGYRLKQGFGSLNGLVGLPRTLAGLYFAHKRKIKKIKNKAPLSSPKINQKLVAKLVRDDYSYPETLPKSKAASAVMLQKKQDAALTKVACIMDEFSYSSYRHECNLLQLTPENWKNEISEFGPELLLIESAWRGKEDLWGNKVGHNSKELQDIIAWCNKNKIPTAFWNKEDPVHFETFLTTAKQFDHVFTTDIDCIHRYKAALGHDNVYFLPFACQPVVNNPIELYKRKDAFCFAGAYYARYPERTRDLGNFVSELTQFKPIDIFDRNYGKDDENYKFPAEYAPYIVGTLPFEKIDIAYKGYRYAINLNSIKQSQSMFARRIFELLGSNTISVSNFSRGLRMMFGDLVITTDSGSEMQQRLQLLAGTDESSAKLRLAALRKIMHEHTYKQRMSYILNKTLKQTIVNALPSVVVISAVENESELNKLIEMVEQQSHQPNKVLVLVNDALKNAEAPEIFNLVVRNDLKGQSVEDVADDNQWLAAFNISDYYGPNYLLDMLLATNYSSAIAFGKAAHYVCNQDDVVCISAEQAYCSVEKLDLRSSIVLSREIAKQSLYKLLKDLDGKQLKISSGLAIDPFNYCRSPDISPNVLQVVNDAELDQGFSISYLQSLAESIKASDKKIDDESYLSAEKLENIFGSIKSKHIACVRDDYCLNLSSTLADGKHEYHYAKNDLTPSELGADSSIKLYLETTPGLNIQLVLLMLDAQKQRISHVMVPANKNITAEVPVEAAFVRLGWRIYSNGNCEVKGLVLGHRDLQPATVLQRSKYLVLTNHYPSYDDLYRNGFVHSRVKAYREQGIGVDIYRLRTNQNISYHEFEGVDVITGAPETLDKMLSECNYEAVLVHFLDSDMWSVLEKHVDKIRVVVWVHGAEIQPWWRREYNYSNHADLEVAKIQSDERLSFWRGILRNMPSNLRLVFVSKYFAEEVMEDIGFRLSENHYSIIHNPINTDIFSYVVKDSSQRCKILSIRPYASAKYANDLTVKAIEILSAKPFFNELEFRLIGDGVLFDELLQPLRKYPNVIIERGFLKQQRIAELHKKYGIFICPTRMDAQGVSRDEAMSSGLVPVTNGVTAIPEFVDHTCGILAAGDSAEEMALGIERLYAEPGLFEAMSAAAAKRVRWQTAQDIVINQEMAEITGCIS